MSRATPTIVRPNEVRALKSLTLEADAFYVAEIDQMRLYGKVRKVSNNGTVGVVKY